MDEDDVQDMLDELREEIVNGALKDFHWEVAKAIGVMAACVVNAINAQPSIDNLKFTTDLIAHLNKSADPDSLSGRATGTFKEILQSTLDQALERAGGTSSAAA